MRWRRSKAHAIAYRKIVSSIIWKSVYNAFAISTYRKSKNRIILPYKMTTMHKIIVSIKTTEKLFLSLLVVGRPPIHVINR